MLSAAKAPFIGRVAELDSLGNLFEDACAGHPQFALIDGPAGIGKSTLLDRFLADHSSAAVLTASGEEGEATLPYAMIDQLLRHGGAAVGALTETAHQHVDSGISEPDPVSAGMRLLDLIGTVQHERPLIVIIDDAQWADPDSMRVLVFALRRLVADRVLTVVASRSEDLASLPDGLRRLASDNGVRIGLQPFSHSELMELASSVGVTGFPARAALRLREHTDGNPLYASALLREVPEATWSGALGRLPPPSSYETLVVGRLRRCSPDARRLVEAAAVLGRRSPLGLLVRVGGVQQELEALDEAIAQDLLTAHEVGADMHVEVGFAHPLTQAAVHEQLAPGHRAALNSAAADCATDERTRLQHRAAAVVTTDDSLADELERFAIKETERGAWAHAGNSFVQASRLSGDPAAAERRMLRAVDSMLYRGDVAQAVAYEETVAAMPSTPLRDCVLGFMALCTHQAERAERLLRRAWESCDADTDTALRATIARRTALHYLYRLRGGETVTWTERALALAGGEHRSSFLAEMLPLGVGAAYAGDLERGLAQIEAEVSPADTGGNERVSILRARGWLRMIRDELPGASEDLAAEARDALALGSLGTAAFALAILARVQYQLGQWDEALLNANRATIIASELEHHHGTMSVASAVAVMAARGDWEEAEEQLAAIRPLAGDYEQPIVALAIANAQIASAQGNFERVLEVLRVVVEIEPREGVDEPGCWPWQHLWAEALVATGDLDGAARFLDHHEALAEARGRASTISKLARVHGKLAAAMDDHETADERFQRAIEAAEQTGMRLDIATSRLAWGQSLRRRGHRRAAKSHLDQARVLFVQLGARPFIVACDSEIAASGLVPVRRKDSEGARLTPQELAVARLVAKGLSNREVAAELVLSVRTIEFHLTHIYSKLNARSRAQLVVLAGADGGGLQQ